MRKLILVGMLGALSVLFVSIAACSNSRGDDAQVGIGQVQAAVVAAKQSDADIKLAAKIRTAILQDSRVALVSDGITILVRGGMVTLQGRVQTQEQKQAAEIVTKSVTGVEKVENLLVVPGG